MPAGRDPSTEDQTTFDPVTDYFTVDGRLSYTFVRKPAAPAAIDTKDYKSTASGKETAATSVATGSVVDKLLDGLTIAVGCNNMFNEQPPFVNGANGNTDLSYLRSVWTVRLLRNLEEVLSQTLA